MPSGHFPSHTKFYLVAANAAQILVYRTDRDKHAGVNDEHTKRELRYRERDQTVSSNNTRIPSGPRSVTRTSVGVNASMNRVVYPSLQGRARKSPRVPRTAFLRSQDPRPLLPFHTRNALITEERESKSSTSTKRRST